MRPYDHLFNSWKDGAAGERVIASEAYWRQPERWNRAAEKAGERHRVFCASLADVFENRPELSEPRVRLFALIAATPHLDWLLLTKRIELADFMIRAHHPAGEVFPLPNVWLGTTVEDQRRADERIPILLDTPAAVRFLSCEPLLGPVDLIGRDAQGSALHPYDADPKIDWVIVGGESGPKARPMDLAWARSLVEQGRSAGVPVFVKQMGARPVEQVQTEAAHYMQPTIPIDLRHRAGGDPDEWPASLRVREFPRSDR